MSHGRMQEIKLKCGNCGKKSKAILWENSQGMYKLHEWLCSDCMCVMDWTVDGGKKYLAKKRRVSKFKSLLKLMLYVSGINFMKTYFD